MIRVRFTTNGNDYRPVIYPPPHPWWRTGYNSQGDAIIVSYADSIEQVSDYWPDYERLDVLEKDLTEYKFSDRMPKPDWFNV